MEAGFAKIHDVKSGIGTGVGYLKSLMEPAWNYTAVQSQFRYLYLLLHRTLFFFQIEIFLYIEFLFSIWFDIKLTHDKKHANELLSG